MILLSPLWATDRQMTFSYRHHRPDVVPYCRHVESGTAVIKGTIDKRAKWGEMQGSWTDLTSR